MARVDPFYIIRGEVTESLNDVQQKMSKFHQLPASDTSRKGIAKQVETECDSILWQVDQLNSAVDVAAEDPTRFNLTQDEIASRRKWIENTRRTVKGHKETLKTATAAPAALPPENRIVTSNQNFVDTQLEKQQLLMKKQDQDLDVIEQGVMRLKGIGTAIGDEVTSQDQLIEELGKDVDTTHTRLKATQRKMAELIRKSGSNTQLALLVFLIIVLIVLAIFAFY